MLLLHSNSWLTLDTVRYLVNSSLARALHDLSSVTVILYLYTAKLCTSKFWRKYYHLMLNIVDVMLVVTHDSESYIGVVWTLIFTAFLTYLCFKNVFTTCQKHSLHYRVYIRHPYQFCHPRISKVRTCVYLYKKIEVYI